MSGSERSLFEDLKQKNENLLAMVKMCYRKHVMEDDSIGWTQLDDTLCNCLCNHMGDDEFVKWLERAKEGLK